MQVFTKLNELQLNVSLDGEAFFVDGIEVNWDRRVVRVQLKSGPRLCPFENVVWLTEPEPEFRCAQCQGLFSAAHSLASHISNVHDRKQNRR